MKAESYYATSGDIAYIRVRTPAAQRVVSEETPWGLLDRDEDTGELVGIEIWSASQALPASLIAALPTFDDGEDLPRPARHAGGAAS